MQGSEPGSVDLAETWRLIIEFAAPRLLPSLVAILIACLVYFPARAILRRVESRLAVRTHTHIDDHAVGLLRRAVQLSAAAWGVWRLLNIWSLTAWAQRVDAVWIVALSFPLSRFVGDVLAAAESRTLLKTRSSLDDTALPLLNKGIRFAIIAVGIILGLDRVGLDITPLVAGAGVMGLAISLAAKDTLSNLIAGVLLILDRPFQVGDRIELWNAPDETGSWGDVIEIGLRATKIRNPDNLVVVVPNNEIMRRDIVNYTMSGQHIRLRIPISVAYDADIERAKRTVLDIATETAGVKADPAPIVIVRGFGPSEVKLQLRVWIEDARRRRAIADEITERTVEAFAEAGIEMPYPKRDVYLHAAQDAPEAVRPAPREDSA